VKMVEQVDQRDLPMSDWVTKGPQFVTVRPNWATR
jgi:hypothetical protein